MANRKEAMGCNGDVFDGAELLWELRERGDMAGCPIAVLVAPTALNASVQSQKREKITTLRMQSQRQVNDKTLRISFSSCAGMVLQRLLERQS